MNWPGLLEAVSKLAWPLLATAVLVLFAKPLRVAIQARGFKIKIGDLELSVQDATEQLRQQVEDLQRQVALLAPAPTSAPKLALRVQAPTEPPRILWVDDVPSNNALLIARFRDRGIDLDLAATTTDALRDLSVRTYAAVISDMGRAEGAGFNADAGLDLLEQMRAQGITVPILFYTSPTGVLRWRAKAEAAGAIATTASPTEMLLALQRAGIDAV